MAIQITKRLTRFQWYAASVAISTLSWRNNIRVLRAINGSGTGQVSYSSTASINSYTTIQTGDILELDSATTGYTIENGAPANGSSGAKVLPPFSGPAGETVTEFIEEYFFDQTSTPSVSFGQGAGTMELSFDNGATWVGLPASIDANNGFKVRVQHPNNAAFSATLTLTYA